MSKVTSSAIAGHSHRTTDSISNPNNNRVRNHSGELDSDHDGIPDRNEDVNHTGILEDDDTDGDGLPDFLDADDDADLLLTLQEDANGNQNPGDDDSDQDGIVNYLDPADDGPGAGDSDNDDLTDDVECPGLPCRDNDDDGRPDYADGDDDNDGLPTFAEDLNNDGNAMNDESDGDGVPNYLDPLEDSDEQQASLGDLVWLDGDRDGVQDAKETNLPGSGIAQGVPGVIITLFSAGTAQPVATTRSDPTGHYGFRGVAPGRYYLEFRAPLGYAFSLANGAPEDAFDSDTQVVEPTLARTDVVELGIAEHNPTLDAGLYLVRGQPALVGGQVWHDADQDGLQTVEKSGIPGIAIELYNSTSQLMATAMSDNDGRYAFTNLAPGDYFLRFILPVSLHFSPANQGNNDTLDSDVDPESGRTGVITLRSNQEVEQWDAGLQFALTPAEIGGEVWLDQNHDNVYGATETGANGTAVQLYTARGQWLVTQVTDVQGRYRFANRWPDSYFLKFIPLPGYELSTVGQGQSNGGNRSANPVSRHTLTTKLRAGEIDLSWDTGLSWSPALVNPFDPKRTAITAVWLDRNQNGIRESAEAGVAAVVIKLYNSSGEAIYSAKTDMLGEMSLPVVAAGDYWLEIIPPVDYLISPRQRGANDAIDSDFDPATGRLAVHLGGDPTLQQAWSAGIYMPTMAINLARFTATAQENAIAVQWVTLSELDVAGFHLYRGVGAEFANAQQVTDFMVQSQGRQGGVYSTTIPYRPLYDPPLHEMRFWLVEVTTDGNRHTYGEFSVMRSLLFLPIIQQ